MFIQADLKHTRFPIKDNGVQVVEKLHEVGRLINIYNCVDAWTCEIDRKFLHTEAPTAPLAICRAALKAVTSE